MTLDERSVSLLLSLLQRYRRRGSSVAISGDTNLIACFHGEDAASIRVTRHEVREILDRIGSELDRLPRRSPVVASLVAAAEDEQSIPLVTTVLAQFDPATTTEADEDAVTTLLTALHDYGGDERAAAAMAGWAGDAGEAGDRAPAARGCDVPQPRVARTAACVMPMLRATRVGGAKYR